MRDELLLYYERELTYLRQLAVGFAERYPKVAARLVLEPAKCEDPHVERLLEAFAFLAARVHMKIDDEFPELTEALLSVVYPQLVRPIPSMSVVQFVLDPARQAFNRTAHSARYRPLFPAGRRRPLCFPHDLQHHVVAALHHRRRVENARPSPARPQGG